jgi:hypothetical protein
MGSRKKIPNDKIEDKSSRRNEPDKKDFEGFAALPELKD